MPWYLIDGGLPYSRAALAVCLDSSAFVQVGPLRLPVLPSGRVHEIVSLPALPDLPAGLTARPLGHLERTWRMAWRVFNTWGRLSAAQRRECGLRLSRILRDLPAAYRVATSFRGMHYATWCREVDALSTEDETKIRACIAGWDGGPRFVIRRLAGNEADWVRTLLSLNAQLYPYWCLEGAAGGVRPDDWLVALRPGDVLRPHALYWVAHEIRRRPDACAVYWDDDQITAAGERLRPRFKPDWSRLHLEVTDYIGRAVALRRDVCEGAGAQLAQDGWRAVLLALTSEAPTQGGGGKECPVVHIPAILSHRPAEEPDPVCRRVPVRVPEPAPKVSILIPTRDALPLLRRCVESVVSKTRYPHYEILVIDNRSRDKATLAWLEETSRAGKIRVLRWDKPFNYSAINNFAARAATGEVLCLLNNDTEVISADWLDEMVGHLCRPKVGAVGAKLYYPDGRIQHAGDTVGHGGCANHLHQFVAGNAPGYCNRAIVAQEVSAVTAACMVTWRDLYLRLGGLNARWLPVAFNDVDYCLRVRKAGYRVVWTPHAELYHHESVSRGKDQGWRKELRAWREVKYMRWKWREAMRHDPFYNPNFSYLRADFALSPAPAVPKPWES